MPAHGAGPGLLQPSAAALTKMDRWVLSRLALAVEQTNSGMEEYNFPQATSALYNFWLYDLCDVYLEYLKPVFSSAEAGAVMTARTVLYTCLDTALRLISPFMPFVSEELFQRLPRWSDNEPPSIMVTSYPTSTSYRDTQVEAEVELVQKIVSVVRSSRADYNIPNKSKTSLHLQIFCPATSAIVAQYARLVNVF